MAGREVAYQMLADSLAGELASAAPGDRVASENELATRYGVARITARAALQELERRHVVRRVRGSGTFVALRLDYPISAANPPSWSEIVRARGHEPGHEVMSIRSVPASQVVAAGLGLPPRSKVVRLRRRGSIDGDVVSHQTQWLAADLVPELRAALAENESLFEAMVERYGLRPERWWSRAELATVPSGIGEELGLEGRPVAWFVESANRCRQLGRVIELSASWLRADAVRVRFEHGPTDTPPIGDLR